MAPAIWLSPWIVQGSCVQITRIQDYGRMYTLLGVFETRLRISIPSVLSAGDITQSNLHWYETLDLSPKGSDALEKAKFKALKFEGPRKSNRPEHFLHLSFWRYLVRSPYYSSLWVPKLHNLLWLIKALDLKLYASALRLIAGT